MNLVFREREEKSMNKSITTLFESEMVEWMNILKETETPFKITNLSDYSGVQYRIEWAE